MGRDGDGDERSDFGRRVGGGTSRCVKLYSFGTGVDPADLGGTAERGRTVLVRHVAAEVGTEMSEGAALLPIAEPAFAPIGLVNSFAPVLPSLSP